MSYLKTIVRNFFDIYKAKIYIKSGKYMTFSSKAVITIGIKTFNRPNCLKLLLRSIYLFSDFIGAPYKVVVADDGMQSTQHIVQNFSVPIKYIRLPFDIGPAAGRNAIVDVVETPYVAIFDDDFVVTRSTNLKAMINCLHKYDLDIVGGVIWDKVWKFKRMPAVLHEVDDTLFVIDGVASMLSESCMACDFVPNFFVAKSSIFKKLSWDNDLFLSEHYAFFVDAKRLGVKVGFTNSSGIVHLQYRNESYRKYRKRAKNFHSMFLKKYGYKKTIHISCKREAVTCIKAIDWILA